MPCLSLQVFVFSRTAYSMIKERLKSKGVADITAKELEGYFSPWHAKHIGQIKVTNLLEIQGENGISLP